MSTISSLEIIETPWRNKLLTYVRSTRKELVICAPYFSKHVVDQIFKRCRSTVQIRFLLGFTRDSLKGGQSDPEALRQIIKMPNRAKAKQIGNLHAKIYIFDGEKAIVTSSNPTIQGLEKNVEFGVFFAGEAATDLVRRIDAYWNDPKAVQLDSQWLRDHGDLMKRSKERVNSEDREPYATPVGESVPPKGSDILRWAMLWSTHWGEHIRIHIEHIKKKGATLWGADFEKMNPEHFNYPITGYLYITGDKVKFKATISAIEKYKTKRKPKELGLRPHKYRDEIHKTFLKLSMLKELTKPMKVTEFRKRDGNNVSPYGLQNYVWVFDPLTFD